MSEVVGDVLLRNFLNFYRDKSQFGLRSDTSFPLQDVRTLRPEGRLLSEFLCSQGHDTRQPSPNFYFEKYGGRLSNGKFVNTKKKLTHMCENVASTRQRKVCFPTSRTPPEFKFSSRSFRLRVNHSPVKIHAYFIHRRPPTLESPNSS